MRLALIVSFLSAISLTAACGHSHDGDFATLQECVVDHLAEGLNESNSITTCLIDHLALEPFADQAACEAYVTANGGYPNSVTQACTDYFAQM
jgi:hypothetical protein